MAAQQMSAQPMPPSRRCRRSRCRTLRCRRSSRPRPRRSRSSRPSRSHPAFDPMLNSFVPQGTGTAPPAAVASGEINKADPRVQALRDLREASQSALPASSARVGPPRRPSALRLAYDAFAEALSKQPNLVSWTVRPSCSRRSGTPSGSPALLRLHPVQPLRLRYPRPPHRRRGDLRGAPRALRLVPPRPGARPAARGRPSGGALGEGAA